ncbi:MULTISPECIES: SHOCT domain-containing protein [unclassified Curtobacterium]|jgi:hypothetical protein|uniref:SHOCT domain-containing protein n=1 Tax=unclassified Curtobacterium TaxID=257496 RepID=UPI0008DE9ED7|nr:SHOCT domain-containing protein [Curtobacterium sp. MCBA15_016]OII16939.1 hypothetical protein BIV03_04845 [Curtobacterium sp. MCBA15_016]
MASSGKVIGGTYVDSMVSTATFGSGIVIQSGFRGRKVDLETVARWEEVTLDARGAKTASAVGQAVVEAVLPRFLSRGASAAIGASIESSSRPPRGVRIEWTDGKQPSLLKLPEDLFTHFELLLDERRAEVEVGDVEVDVAVVTTTAAAAPAAPQTLTEQAFSMVSGLFRDRAKPTASATPAVNEVEAASPSTSDLTEQLMQLAQLRDAGVLTEAEFAAKKAELLARI